MRAHHTCSYENNLNVEEIYEWLLPEQEKNFLLLIHKLLPDKWYISEDLIIIYRVLITNMTTRLSKSDD